MEALRTQWHDQPRPPHHPGADPLGNGLITCRRTECASFGRPAQMAWMRGIGHWRCQGAWRTTGQQCLESYPDE